MGQKAGNFWANCDGQVARPVRAHLEAVCGTDHLGHLGHQASGAKSCTAICHVAEPNHGILQLFNNRRQRAKRLAAGAQLVLRPFTSSFTPGCYSSSWPRWRPARSPPKKGSVGSVCPPPSIRKSINSGFVNDSWPDRVIRTRPVAASLVSCEPVSKGGK